MNRKFLVFAIGIALSGCSSKTQQPDCGDFSYEYMDPGQLLGLQVEKTKISQAVLMAAESCIDFNPIEPSLLDDNGLTLDEAYVDGSFRYLRYSSPAIAHLDVLVLVGNDNEVLGSRRLTR
ncbi:hypothetical protein ED21_30054 [Erythrobacter sp. SD-21]|nr:hypothetical protein ED21_30054 [Erythrobacter sp. SD-21]